MAARSRTGCFPRILEKLPVPRARPLPAFSGISESRYPLIMCRKLCYISHEKMVSTVTPIITRRRSLESGFSLILCHKLCYISHGEIGRHQVNDFH